MADHHVAGAMLSAKAGRVAAIFASNITSQIWCQDGSRAVDRRARKGRGGPASDWRTLRSVSHLSSFWMDDPANHDARLRLAGSRVWYEDQRDAHQQIYAGTDRR